MKRRMIWSAAAALALTSTGCAVFQRNTVTPVTSPNQSTATAEPQVTARPSDKQRQPSANLLSKMAIAREGELVDGKINPEMRMKGLDDVRRIYQDSLKLDPNHAESWAGLGRVYSQMENTDKALETYKIALEKFPRDVTLWHDQGQCFNRRKDFESAKQSFQKALEIDPENRAVLQSMGFTLARAGQPEQAIPYLTRALGSAAAHYNVARMMLHINRPDAARQHLEQAVANNPSYQPAQALLANLSPLGNSGVTQASFTSP